MITKTKITITIHPKWVKKAKELKKAGDISSISAYLENLVANDIKNREDFWDYSPISK